MFDDANFCRGRLRLAAFLRIVQNDGPRRPTRFRSRIPLAERKDDQSNGPLTEDTDSSVEESPSRDGAHTPVYGTCGSLPRAETPPSLAGCQSSQIQSDGQSGWRKSANFDLNIPCSSSPTRLNARSDHETIGEQGNGRTSGNNQSTLQATGRSNNITKVVHKRRPMTSSTNPAKSLRTRKRRLPVSGLALLRTTTSDGLPIPSVRSLASVFHWSWPANRKARTPVTFLPPP